MRSNRDRVQCLEMAAISRFVPRKESVNFCRRHRAFLKAPLRKHRHLHAEYRANPARDDLSLERVEPLMRSLRELCEWNRLGDRDHSGARVGTACIEPILVRARVAP